MKTFGLKWLIIGVALGIVVVIFLREDLVNKKATNKPGLSLQQTTHSQPEKIQIISTKPQPLEGTTILPTQTIEITFNKPLENIPEFKNKIEPEVNYKIELSFDKKIVKIIPEKSWALGTEYTLFILPDTKFKEGDKKEVLDRETIFHFKTIKYRGV